MAEVGAGHARGTYATKQAKSLGLGHIICGCIVLVMDLFNLLIGDGPTFGIFSSVAWFLSGGFAIGGAASKTRCLIVATMVSFRLLLYHLSFPAGPQHHICHHRWHPHTHSNCGHFWTQIQTRVLV